MNDKPQATEGLEFHAAGSEMLVHDIARRKIHVLNRSAANLLRACDGVHDIDALAHELSGGVPDQRAYDDVERIVAQFRELKLVAMQVSGVAT